MSEYIAVQSNQGDFLMHYGVPGMKWGVRKLITQSGGYGKKFAKRYGANGKRSARGMQRDYNKLDKSYANVSANSIHAAEKLRRAKNKQNFAKTEKFSQQLADTKKQLKGIENVQGQILNKAKKAGYTTSAQKVQRKGIATNTKRTALGAWTVGGVIPGAIATSVHQAYNRNNISAVVNGSKVKIKKKGPGGTANTNYYKGQKHQNLGTIVQVASRNRNKRR